MDNKLKMVGATSQEMADRALYSYCSLPGAELGAEMDPTLHDVVKAYAQQIQKSGGPAYDARTVDQFVKDFAQENNLSSDVSVDACSRNYQRHPLAQDNQIASFETMTKALYAYQAINIDHTAHHLGELDHGDLAALKETSLASSKRVERLGGLLEPLRAGPLTPRQLLRADLSEEKRLEPKNSVLANKLDASFKTASGVETIDPTNRGQVTETIRSLAKATGLTPSPAEIAATAQIFRNEYYGFGWGNQNRDENLSLKGAPPLPPFKSR